jgi:hypothetical protein
MIQITLTPKQLELVKDALNSFDEGYLETEQECQEFKGLKQFIDYKANTTQQEVSTEQFVNILFEGDKVSG